MKSISRRRLITSAFPAIFLSNNPSKADQNILIGLLLSNSGQYHKVSKMLEKGIKRALDELNTENILFKKKIYIIKEEYNGDPLLIKQQVTSLLNKNVNIIFSPFGDASMLSTSNILKGTNISLVNTNLTSNCLASTLQLGPTITQLTYPLIKTLINTGRKRFLFVGDTGLTSSNIRRLTQYIINNSKLNSLAFGYSNLNYFEDNSEEIYKISKKEKVDVIILARSFAAGNDWLKDAIDRGIAKHSDIALIDIDDTLTEGIKVYGSNSIYQISIYNKLLDSSEKYTINKNKSFGSLSFINYLAILAIYGGFGNINQMLGQSFYSMNQKFTIDKKGAGLTMPLYLVRTDSKGINYSGSYGSIPPNLKCKGI